MKCDDVRQKLSLLLTDNLSGEEEKSVREHIALCQLCGAELKKFENAIRKFREDALSAGAGEFDSRIRERVHCVVVEERSRKISQTWWRVAAVLLAGLVLFTVMMGSWLYNPRGKMCRCHSWAVSGIATFSRPDMEYPVVREKRVFALQTEGRDTFLVCFEKSTGQVLWRSQFAVVPGIITADRTRVFVCKMAEGTFCPVITALDGATGKILWEKSFSGEKMARNTRLMTMHDNGMIYISGDHITYIEPASGRYIWRAVPVNNEITSIVEHEKKLYVASSDTICAISTDTGNIVWKESLTSKQSLSLWTMCDVSNDRLFVARRGINSGSISCHDIHTGKLIWETPTDSPPRSMRPYDKLLFVRTSSLQALDIQKGTMLWNISLEGCSSPQVFDEMLLVLGGKNHNIVMAVDAITGMTKWKKELTSSCSGLIVAGKMIFVSGHDYTLWALRLAELETHPKSKS